jgi:hypothetical protein
MENHVTYRKPAKKIDGATNRALSFRKTSIQIGAERQSQVWQMKTDN